MVKRSSITRPLLEHLAEFSRYQTEQAGVMKFYNLNGTATGMVLF